MKTIVIAVAMSLCVVSVATVLSADTLIMRDGTRAQGTVTGIAGRTITFRHADGESRRYPTSQVASLEFVSPDRSNPRAVSARNLELPAGTELVVRTVNAIDSRHSSPDQSFSAIVEREVSDAPGRLIVLEGAGAQLVIRHVSSGGAGSPEVVLDIQSITVGGRRYLVSTVDVTDESDRGIGTNTRTADTVGGGAAVGTIIGAIAGGGNGGHDVKVPPETVLRFRLDQPVTLRAEQ
jgi:hypothetical protein